MALLSTDKRISTDKEQSQSTLATKNDLEKGLAKLELRLTESMYKMAGFIIVGVGAMLGIFKFFS